jgi:diadenosine tetraphosphatase ApaH/serine/threonine PP2A family protein phosphatase
MTCPSADNLAGVRTFIETTPSGVIPEGTVIDILTRLGVLLIQENNVLVLQSPIYICGDIHGQLNDLLYLLSQCNRQNAAKLFLGDYVDRGLFSLHSFLYLACLKLESPRSVFLLRGNHESRQSTNRYGFLTEITTTYGGSGLWSFIHSIFDLLPLAAVIDREVFCVHGGISPSLPLIERISLIERRLEVPMCGPMTDLLWSDPDEKDGWELNRRGAGHCFGPLQSRIFCLFNRLQFIARAHQVKANGYEKHHLDLPSEPESYRVITIFSAPCYGGEKNRNSGAYMAYGCDPDNVRKIVSFTKAPDPPMAAGQNRQPLGPQRFVRSKEYQALAQIPKYEREL